MDRFDKEDLSFQEKENKKHSIFFYAAVLILGSALVGTSFGIGFGAIENYSEKDNNYAKTEQVQEADDLEDIEADGVLTSFKSESANTVNLIKAVKPSVVCISAKSQGYDFFYTPVESTNSSSGVVFHQTAKNVYIVTNYNLIQGSSQVGISFEDGETFIDAKLVGKDVSSDVAVLSVSKADLKKAGITGVTTAKFGNSDNVQPAEEIVAIGNALGNGNTATQGIVSSVDRTVEVGNRQLKIIQTDAAINIGNYGGAIYNYNGEVIGIVDSKLVQSTVEGISYALASNNIKEIVEQIMSTGDSPVLGVYISNITEEMAQQYNLPAAGVVVESIIPGGSADGSDLQAGDIITSFNDKPVFTSNQLIEMVKQCKVGDTVALKVYRGGMSGVVKIKLVSNSSTSF